jgi:LPS O-antigen subunit length determinant protein (WzzB/FepE family)
VQGDSYFFVSLALLFLTMIELKQKLYAECLKYVQTRIDTAQQSIQATQQAANEETKSSAGDKYETGRAMMQQETDRNMAQLNEANKLKVALNQISSNHISTAAEAGSVVITDNGNFYLAISAGALTIDGKAYFAVSPASPIGFKMKGLKKGDEFRVNGKDYRIEMLV